MTTHTFLERKFDEAYTPADIYAGANESVQCFDLHRVNWHGSFLNADGRSMVCWFSAVDAESIRIALRQSDVDIRRLWRGTVHVAPQAAAPNVVVERTFDSPVEFAAIAAKATAGAGCFELHRVKHARSFFALDRKRMLCFYAAPDAESVRIAQREADMPVDRVWAFSTITPPPSSRRE
jgi:Nickel responsive protein SCO4226-like